MNIKIMMDSFKGSATSKELGSWIKDCLKHHGFDAEAIPISDGGEGFLDMIEHTKYAKRIYLEVGKNEEKLLTYYLMDHDVAYVELAKVCGYKNMQDRKSSILDLSTYVLGEVIKNAMDHEAHHVILGLGGSAANDGGMGMLEALGFEFLDEKGNPIHQVNPRTFHQVKQIKNASLFKEKSIQFTIVCDVRNELLGPNGATYTYGRQKGASEDELKFLEAALEHIVDVATPDQKDYATFPGSGAAGGTGYAAYAYLNAKRISGVDFIKEHIGPMEKTVDLLITGEGKVDDTSKNGKVVFELINLIQARKNAIICGRNDLSENNMNSVVFAIVPNYATFEQSMSNPKPYIEKIVTEIISLLKTIDSMKLI